MTKKAPKQKTKKKDNTMAMAVHKEKSLQWGGVMPKVANQEADQAKLQAFCNEVAKVYGVPSLGVNAMGGNPYLNKDGRLYLMGELRTGKEGLKAIRKDFIKYSGSLEEPAIIKVTLVFRDGHEVEAIGEASKQSVKLDAVKQTLNMMAETRGMNRAIWQEIGHDVWRRVEKRIAVAKMSDEEKARVINAGQVSYEEMNQPKTPRAKNDASSPSEIVEMSLESIKRLNDIEKIDKICREAKGSTKITDEQKEVIIEAGRKRIDALVL